MSLLQHRRILVVDDNADTRVLFQLVLELEGADVITVASVAEAISVLSWRRVDGLISDIALPGEDGCTLLSRLRSGTRQDWRRIPALAVTATIGDAMQQRTHAAGFRSCLTKPVNIEELLAAVVEMLPSKILRLDSQNCSVQVKRPRKRLAQMPRSSES